MFPKVTCCRGLSSNAHADCPASLVVSSKRIPGFILKTRNGQSLQSTSKFQNRVIPTPSLFQPRETMDRALAHRCPERRTFLGFLYPNWWPGVLTKRFALPINAQENMGENNLSTVCLCPVDVIYIYIYSSMYIVTYIYIYMYTYIYI